MKKLYVFDLDGTLANIDHRLHLIKTEKPDWPSFYRSCVSDTQKQWVIDLLHLCRTQGEILILSGRSDEVEGYTRDWLKEKSVLYDYLVMRESGDYSPDDKLKKIMLEEFLRDKDFSVQFIVDDRQRVVDMWRAKGYNVLQCNAWKEN